jgi:hypothetical protein
MERWLDSALQPKQVIEKRRPAAALQKKAPPKKVALNYTPS